MGVNLLNLGMNGLFTAQNQLATTSHNIANVNTEGYSRQRAIQETTAPIVSGGQFIGTGSRIQGVERVFNQFRYNELTFANSANSFATTTANQLGALDEQMSKVGKGLSQSLNDFYSSVNSLTDSPSDLGVRKLTLAKAATVTQNINSMYNTLESKVDSLNEDLSEAANKVTALGKEIAVLNRNIVATKTQVTSPNDMLDKRNQLLQELAKLTSVSTTETADGAMSVHIGDGQTLVAGVKSFSMEVAPGSPDLKQQQLVMVSPNGVKQQIKGDKMGGAIGALTTFRDGPLKDTINKLGVTAVGLAESFNKLQAQGLDMNEIRGQNFFQDINAGPSMERRVLADKGNGGNLVGEVEITDVAKLSGHDYEVNYDGANYSVTNLSTGKSQTFAGMPIVVDGMTFKAKSGTANAGDKFILQPTRLAAGELKVELTDPEQIAASSVVEIRANKDNVSTGKVSLVSVDNSADANFPKDGSPLSLEVYRDNAGVFQYQLKNSAGANVGPAGTYTPPSQKISLAGMTFEIEGQPVGQGVNAPEKFEIEYAFGASNNNNAKAMAALQTAKVMNDGRSTIADTFENNVVEVGAAAATADVEAGAAKALHQQATTRVSNSSGVNIDEEASNLLRFQQAYSASARIVTTANEIFQTLLQAAR